jgi:tight adherence protein B
MSAGVLAAGLCALATSLAVIVAGPAPPSLRRRAGVRRVAGPVAAPARSGGARAGAPPLTSVPMMLDLVATALAGGAAPPRAVAVVAECLERAGDPTAADLRGLALRMAAGPGAGRGTTPAGGRAGQGVGAVPGVAPRAPTRGLLAVEALAAALEMSIATGAGPVELIRSAAEDRRRRAHADEVRAAHRLAVMVLLPSGLCLLPAFVLLTVVPLVIDLVLG